MLCSVTYGRMTAIQELQGMWEKAAVTYCRVLSWYL